MKKIALFVALAMIAASPALAAPKKKVAAKQPEMADWQKQNDNSYRFARDSLPIFLPSWAQAVYQVGIKPKMEADAKPVAKKKKSKTAAKTN
ncbi:MAG: hypothetical protein ABWY66_10500 [Xanthobacteraceae bacterium]|jgi:hypothetical protein